MNEMENARGAAPGQDDAAFDVLFTFECEENGRSYMAYTDRSVDETGAQRVFAARYAEDGKAVEPIDTQDEWEMIRTILDEIQGGLASAGQGG